MNFVILLLAASTIGWTQGVTVRTSAVRFQTAPLTGEGSLANQALKARALIAGDVHRLRAFVLAEEDATVLEDILKAPAVAIVKVTGLPLKGARISLEAVTSGGANPHGLVFISGQGGSAAQATPLVRPVVETSFRNLDTALQAAQLGAQDALQMTCYLSSLDEIGAIGDLAAARFPRAARSFAQVPVPRERGFAECEVIAAARQATGFFNPDGLTASQNFTHVAGVSTRQMVWSGMHLPTDCSEQGVREMFSKLSGTLKSHGASIEKVAMSYLYPNSARGTELTRELRFDYYWRSQPPASTLLGFSGLAAEGACTGVEVAAPK